MIKIKNDAMDVNPKITNSAEKIIIKSFLHLFKKKI
jgi:hypothetical protein